MPLPPPPKMSAPVTRDEFRHEVDRLDRRLDGFEARTEKNFSTFLDAILDRMDARFASQERRYDERFAKIDERFERMECRFDELKVDLARHANAIQENVAQQIRAIDDKYKDLPGRVAVLEAAQPSPPSPRKRAR